MSKKRIIGVILGIIVLLFVGACSVGELMGSDAQEELLSRRPTGKGGGGGGAGGGGGGGGQPPPHVEAFGNNLSVPVIFSDGVEKTLRGDEGNANLVEPYVAEGETAPWEAIDPDTGLTWVDANGIPYLWYAQDTENHWRAETATRTSDDGMGVVHVDRVDWGDNMEARAWRTNSVLRVEVVLFKDLPEPMTAYTMTQISEVKGKSEIWGTNGVTYPSNVATIYSGCAQLAIQPLLVDRESPELSTLAWVPGVAGSDGEDDILGHWVGADLIDAPVFSGGVWSQVDGPSGYSAEINVGGKVIYGYNWMVRTMDLEPGDYRITFSLEQDPRLTNCARNTTLAEAVIDLPVEEEIMSAESEDGDGGEPDLGGGVAVIDYDNELTYIDVRLE